MRKDLRQKFYNCNGTIADTKKVDVLFKTLLSVVPRERLIRSYIPRGNGKARSRFFFPI